MNESKWNDNEYVNFYNAMDVSVNGVALLQKDKTYNVKINENQLDTIRIKGGLESWTILAKLNSGIIYKIIFNPCSNFQIVPSKKNEGIKLVRLIATNRNNNNRLFLNSSLCFIDSNQLRNKDTTDYFMIASSGNCPYAPASFKMCSKDIEDINSKEDAKDCHGIMLYFSGSEMFTLNYDYRTKLMTAKFDGYYDEKLNIKIGEINRE